MPKRRSIAHSEEIFPSQNGKKDSSREDDEEELFQSQRGRKALSVKNNEETFQSQKGRKGLSRKNDEEEVYQSQKRKKIMSQKNDKEDDGVLRINSLFGELITKAGYILRKNDLPNLLNCDQAVFQKDLTYRLKCHPVFRLPEIAEKFVKGLEDHIEDPQRLKWSLLYTQTVSDCETARGGHQDSLFRLCLNIAELQPHLIQLLTEKLLEVANDDEARSEANIPCLILANLKWLDYVIDSDTLTTKIVEIIEGSPFKVQQDVISYIPNIVNDANHPRLAEVLCDLYETTPDLTSSILDTLGDLTLPKESLAEVFHSVLKTLHSARPDQLPIILKFLLNNTQASVAYQVLSDVREKINLPGDCQQATLSPRKSSRSNPSKDNDNPAYETLLLNNIKMTVITNKFLATNWLKAIQDVCTVANVRPIDFLVLLILYDAVPSQRHPIESIFRNRIRTGLFSDKILRSIFDKHVVALKENFKSLKKISSLLLRSSEPLVRQTAATLYKLCFLHLDGHYRQESMLALLNHLGDSSPVRHTALTLLSMLAHKHTAEMSKFTIFIKGSMEMMDELSMREVKRLLDVVSLLVFSDSSHAALQDELMILVRKQLCHTDSKFKHIGVLTAALILKNMVNEEDSGTTDTSTASDRSFMNTRALKEAENLLCLVMSSTAHTPTAAALFMDELASISLRENMNNKLEEFMNQKMADEFQNNFVVEFEPNATHPQEPFAMAASWNLDADVEGACIALNLAPLVVKAESSRLEPSDKKIKLVCLTPQFRLLRMLECRIRGGDLHDIDALLGCPIISPAPEVFDNFDNLVVSEQHMALSCLFYTVNWFRELLNAFVTQKEREMKDRIYQRLDQVIELENLIAKYLPKCPDYVPPIAVFDLDCSMATPAVSLINVRKGKRGRKPGSGKGKGAKSKGKKANTEGTQLGTQVCTTQPTTQVPLSLASQSQANKGSPDKNAASEPVLDKASLRPFLRELHFDVFYLLFRKLALPLDAAREGALTVAEIEFLLTDLNSKLDHVFGTSNKRASVLGNSQEKNIGHSHLDLFSPAEVAEHIIQILKPLCVHMEGIGRFFHTLIEDNDGIMDAPNLFTDLTRPVMKVNLQLFTAMHGLLSWKGLQQEGNKESLLSILRVIARKYEGDVVSSMDQEELTTAVFGYLSNFHATIVDLGTATVLVQTLVAVAALPQHEDLTNSLMEVIEGLLKREWYTTGGEKEKGTLFNQNLHTLLQEYLKQSKDPLKQMETLCSEGLEQFQADGSKNRQSETFPTLNKNSLFVYYKVILSFLVSGTNKSLAIVGTAPDNSRKRLLVWNTAIKILHTHVTILKNFYSRQMLSTCLKFTRPFLELFLRSAMPLMDTCFREHNQDVVMLLKSVQGSTRFLQNLCTHSKVKQDTTLTCYVPPLRRSLETLVYRVKAMLALNKCHNAFWMGILKNRDLHGEEILSQRSMEELEEEDNGEEEVAEENEQSDVDIEDVADDATVEEDKISDYSDSF